VTATESRNPFAIVHDHSATARDGWRLPTFAPGSEQPVLDRSETVIDVIEKCHLQITKRDRGETSWTTVWQSPKPGTLSLTSRRVVYGCRRFETGSTYGGFGLGGIAAGIAMTAVSKGVAKARAIGHCFGAQARHEWTIAIALTRYNAASSGEPAGCLHIDVVDGDRRWRFNIWGDSAPGIAATAAETYAATVIAGRLAQVERLSPDDIAALKAVEPPQLRRDAKQTTVIDLAGADDVSGARPAAPSRLRFN
jgi:hypothetical protein